MTSTGERTRIQSLSRVLGMVLALAALGVSNGAFAAGAAHCGLNEFGAPSKPFQVLGKSRGMAPPEEVQRQTHIAELRSGGAVSPDYVALPRILAVYFVGGVSHTTIAAVIDGHIPQPGDIVKLESRHRDARSPCNFIPWTVVPAAAV